MTLYDWLLPVIALLPMAIVVWAASRDEPGSRPRRAVRIAVLGGCFLCASVSIAILLDKGVPLPGLIASLGLGPITILSVGLINLFAGGWSERFPGEGFPKLAARVYAGIAAFTLVPSLGLGPLAPGPGGRVAPFMSQLAFGFLGTVACLGLWGVMWLVARRAVSR